MPAFNVTQRITANAINIDFPLLRESVEEDDFDHIIHTTKDGSVVQYTRNTQKTWPLDIICTEAEADTTIRDWIENRRQVVFVPDLIGAPGTTHNTRIMNTTFPFAYWGNGKWRGTLQLRKE